MQKKIPRIRTAKQNCSVSLPINKMEHEWNAYILAIYCCRFYHVNSKLSVRQCSRESDNTGREFPKCKWQIATLHITRCMIVYTVSHGDLDIFCFIIYHLISFQHCVRSDFLGKLERERERENGFNLNTRWFMDITDIYVLGWCNLPKYVSFPMIVKNHVPVEDTVCFLSIVSLDWKRS